MTINKREDNTMALRDLAPRITGPAEVQRSGPPPQFDVDPGDGPAIYYGVELAVSPDLLNPAGSPNRTAVNYYASWQDTALMSSNPYVLSEAVWEQLRFGPQLVYRAWLSTDPSGWVDTVLTTPDDQLEFAPVIRIVDTGQKQPPTAISDRGLELIGRFEGLRTELYNDVAGHCTIGYGHLVHHGNCDGSELEEFRAGISQQRALDLLRIDAQDAATAVRDGVTVPLNQQQFDALVSFTFNVGAAAFSGSTLRKRLNNGEYDAVPDELNRWVRAGGVVQPGLVKRRGEEGVLFRDGVYP